MNTKIDTILLDVDNTLYHKPDLSSAYDNAMLSLICTKKQIKVETAKELIKDAKNALRHRIKTVSSTKALLEIGITLDDWISHSCHQVDPRNFLQPDTQLIVAIKNLIDKQYKIGIISNNNRIQIERTFQALGIESLLNSVLILSISETGKLKPDTSIYLEALKVLNSTPMTAIAVGDRQDVDLDPAEEIGMKVYLVQNLADLYKFPDYLNSLNSSSL